MTDDPEYPNSTRVPEWLPGVVAAMLPNFVPRTRREVAILGRLTHDARMKYVWRQMAIIEPKPTNRDAPARALFSLAYHTAIDDKPATLTRERAARIRAAGGWAAYFTSFASIHDSVVIVSHKPPDPIAKCLQQTLVAWLKSMYGSEHLGIAETVTEVALDCETTRMAGRLPQTRNRGAKSRPKLIPLAGC